MYRRVWAEMLPAHKSGSSTAPRSNNASNAASTSSSSDIGSGSNTSGNNRTGSSLLPAWLLQLDCPVTAHGLIEAALPGTYLLGRHLLHWTEQQQRAPAAPDSMPTADQDAMQPSLGLISPILQESKLFCSYLQRGEGLLSAAGYAVSPVLQLWQDTVQAAQATDVAGWDDGSSQRFMQQLGKLGLALTALPISYACSNPYCCNLEGLSEQQLVTGSSHKCSACRTARYCSPACQSAHWAQHKTTCKALRAAAAGKKAASSRTLAAGSAQP